jgi:hypothetical protein
VATKKSVPRAPAKKTGRKDGDVGVDKSGHFAAKTAKKKK